MTRDHGGNLDAAIARFGGADWIDLSTGINRVPYPVGDLPPEAWSALPGAAATARLMAAARACYRLAPGADLALLSGAQGAIQLLPRLGAPGRARIYGPTYNEHAAALSAAGWAVETVTDLAAIRDCDLGLVVNPNNPGGEHVAPAALLALRGRVGRLVVDESFVDATPDLTLGPALGAPGLFVLRSFGKFYGLAGLRLGAVAGAPQEIAALREMAGPWPVCGPALAIGARALADRPWAEATIARLGRDCARLDALARARGWTLRGGTALFRLYSCANATAAQAALASCAIWSRIFPWSDSLIRLGLPGGEEEWRRITLAMEAA